MRHLLAVCVCLVLGGVLVYPVLKPIGAERCGVWNCESAEQERENEHPHMPGRLYFDPDGKVWYEMQD